MSPAPQVQADTSARKPPSPLFSLRSHRLKIALLLMTGLWATASMRLNLSMAITCMVNGTAYETPGGSYANNASGEPAVQSQCARSPEDMAAASDGYNGSLLWSPSMQSLLLSATFYGGLVTIAASGYIADRFAPKLILILATLTYVAMSVVAPWLAATSYAAYFASRVVMGLGEGFVMPALASLAARWFPSSERSSIAAMYTSGNQFAAGLSPLLSASLCAGTFLGGWPAIFYIFGLIGAVWLVVFWVFGSDYPSENRWVSDDEKTYLDGCTSGKNQKPTSVPWRAMLLSTPLLANLACQFSFQMSAALMQGFLPTYFKQVLMLPIASNGVYTMVPFVFQLASKNVLALFSDWMKRRGLMRPTFAVKTFQTVGSIGSAATLFGMATIPDCSRPWTALVLLALYGVFFSCGICGFFTSILLIAPAYSGTLTSIAMIFGMAGSLSGPLLISAVSGGGAASTWYIVFGACAAANLISGAFFLAFASGDVQPWAVENKIEGVKKEEEEC